MPTARTFFADVPGHIGGGIDITEMQIKHPMFENRKGNFQFLVVNGYEDWDTKYQMIRNYLHGKRLQIILDDEPELYYEGRLKVNQWQSKKVMSTITIDYNVDPYKRNVNNIPELTNQTVNGQRTIVVACKDEVTAPFITTSAGLQCTLNGSDPYTLPAGRSRNPEMILIPWEDNTYIFRGQGTVTIDYRGGML